MELRHLRYFVALAEELNFTRAAKKLRLAQPSLTRQIRDLEEELGARLLERTSNGVLLTEHGRFLLNDARRLVALSQELVTSVRQFKGNGSAHLNIGYLPRFDSELLPSTLLEFQQGRPEIGIQLFEMPPADQFRALKGRTIDAGFIGLRVDHDPMLNWNCVARADVVIALPVRHALAKKTEINLLELNRVSFVTLSEHTHPGWRKWIFDFCAQAGFIPRIIQEVNSESEILNFVAEGLGVALTNDRIRRLPHAGVVFRPMTAAPQVGYWVAWHRDNRSNALTHYLTLLNETAKGRQSLHRHQVWTR